MKKEITNKDLLEAMNIFSESVDKRFEGIEVRLDRVESEMGSMKSRIGSIESNMVTKDYLDRKFSSFSGDMVEMISRAIKRHELKMHTV